MKITLAVLTSSPRSRSWWCVLSGSVALLADTIHNFSDALTAVPLWIAFVLGRPVGRRGATPTATGVPRTWPACSSSP